MPRPPEPGTGPEREEERQRKLAALRARLREDARSLRTPDDWARCLRLAALMPGEDFANILLVSGQRPAAVMVADYRQWTAMGRQVRRGEKAPGRRAHRFAASWAPAYLEGRDISAAVAAEWDIGYAPAGWTTLTDHLRSLGHGDDEIEAAGLAKPSTRGTFIDRFRDRVMLPVHDERQARWVHRTREPRCRAGRAEVPQQPETAGFRKGSLLFGLHRARPALAQGAIPVIAEGPFDAIAVNLADPGRHAGLAPCGTALTSQQASLLSQAADLPRRFHSSGFAASRRSRTLAAVTSTASSKPMTSTAICRLRPFTSSPRRTRGRTWRPPRLPSPTGSR
jgi:hypothetical protein